MNNKNGFITLMSLTIMAVVLISALYLMYIYSLEYMIINSTINSIQSCYYSEGKIYLVLNNNKYLNELTPNIEWFLKNSDFATIIEDIYIHLDKEDLIGTDNYNLVLADIYHDYDGRTILEFSTKSTYNKITRKVISKVTIINELYELGIPIVSTSTLDKEGQSYFNKYINFLEANIKMPDLDKGIYGIEANDFEKVKLIDEGDKIIIKYFRNEAEIPVRMETVVSDTLFLLCSSSTTKPEITVESSDTNDELKLSGIIYIEGNLVIRSDIELNGIVILNGSLNIEPSAKMSINGIMLYKGNDELSENKNLNIQYDIKQIRKFGIYIPKFIDLEIRNIKSD